MKKRYILSFLVAAVLGTAWHFLYDVLPCPVTALIAPVNESVWEHLKLLYFPPLAVVLYLSFRTSLTQREFWSRALTGLLFMPAFLLGAYYALTAGFGVPLTPAVDIPLYYLTLALGFLLAATRPYGDDGSRLLGPMVIAFGVLGTALVVFTAAAPPLPVFISAV